MSVGTSQQLKTIRSGPTTFGFTQTAKENKGESFDDSDEYYANMFNDASEEPSGVLSIHRVPSNYEIPLQSEQTWKRALNIVLALVFPFPYALLFGSSGRWDLKSVVYLGRMFCCPTEIDADALRPALLVWSVICGVLWIIIWALSQSVFLAILAGYFFASAFLLCLLWCKTALMKDRRLFYETL